jgi:hypothetical protein
MPSYLWTAKDRFGNATVQRVTADTVRHAREVLSASGCTDLRLQTDEVVEASLPEGCDLTNVPAEEHLARLRQGPMTAFDVAKGSFAGAKGTVACLVVLAALGIYLKKPSMVVISVAGVLIFPAIALWYAQAGFCYTRLNQARTWSRWEEVLRCVEKLRRIQKLTKLGVGETELARCRSQAFAGLKRIDDALRELDRLRDSPRTPVWMYFSLVGNAYQIAERHDEGIKYLQQAIEHGPENSTYGSVTHLRSFTSNVTPCKRGLRSRMPKTLRLWNSHSQKARFVTE